MKTASVLGLILVVLGMVTLLYYVAPIRLLADAVEPHQTSPMPAILGGLALLCGVGLLLAIRPRN
jgi:hypothetical protein